MFATSKVASGLHVNLGVLIGALLAVAVLVLARTARNGTRRVPPGPPPAFLLGNALHLPKVRPWLKLHEWGRKYGDVISFKIFSRQFVVVESYEAACALFEKRSSVYSQRPQRAMAQMCGFGKALLFQSYGESVRQARRLMHKELNARSVVVHQDLQQQEARRMALRFIDNKSTSITANLRLTAAAALLRITYGHEVKDDNDPLVGLAEEVMNNLADVITPNKFLVDNIPALRHLPSWFPGCGFQSVARDCKELLETFMSTPFEEVRDHLQKGTALPSFTLNLLEDPEEPVGEQKLELYKWTAGGIYAAGSDTTISILTSFFLAMLLHPDVVRKAHNEIDKVVGRDRLPTFQDRPNLPYIECVLKEVLRWNPATPLISRSTNEDDEYNGMTIPAKSVVMVNVWSLTHDPNAYEDASKFIPERFLPLSPSSEKTASASSIPPDPRLFVFGFGRRNCPGSHLADSFIYAVIVTMLAVFRFEPEFESDRDGRTRIGLVDPDDLGYSTGAVSHPAPFTCKLIPRFSDIESHLRAALDV